LIKSHKTPGPALILHTIPESEHLAANLAENAQTSPGSVGYGLFLGSIFAQWILTFGLE